MSENASAVEVVLSAEIPPPQMPRVQLLVAARKRYQDTRGLLGTGQGAEGGTGLADVEFVHDLRVASRRLGEVARLLRSFMDKPTDKAVEACLKALRRAMGDLRDLDVTREHLLKWRMPGPVKGNARSLAAELALRRQELEAAGRAQMGSASISGAMVVLARVLEVQDKPENAAAAEKKLEMAAAAQVRRRQRQMRRAFGQAARKQTPEALHAARIAIKKLRYILELLQDGSVKRGLKGQIRELKRLQQLLGDHHDVHVITGTMAEHLKKPGEKDVAKRRKLGVAWRRWQREMHHAQAKRAATFFAKSYAWMNA